MRIQTFGHGHNDERDGDDQDLDERKAPLARRALDAARAELDEESYHEGNKQHQACSTAEFRDELCQVVELQLQWRVVIIAAQRLRKKIVSLKDKQCGRSVLRTHHDPTVEGPCPNCDDHITSVTF